MPYTRDSSWGSAMNTGSNEFLKNFLESFMQAKMQSKNRDAEAEQQKQKNNIELIKAGYVPDEVSSPSQPPGGKSLFQGATSPDMPKSLLPQDKPSENPLVQAGMMTATQPNENPQPQQQQQQPQPGGINIGGQQYKMSPQRIAEGQHAKFETEKQIRSEYGNNEAVQTHDAVKGALDRAEKAYSAGSKGPNSAADMSLAINFVRTIDPKVRNAADAAEAASREESIPGWIKQKFDSLSKGGVLTPEQRNQMMEMAKQNEMAAAAARSQVDKFYQGIAQKNGLDLNNVIFKYEPAAAPEQTKTLLGNAPKKLSAPRQGSGPKVGAVEDGYQYMGGDPKSKSSWKAVQ